MIKKFKDFKKINEDIIHSNDNIPNIGAKVESVSINEHKDNLTIKIEGCNKIILVGDFNKSNTVNETNDYYDGWIGVDSYKDIPEGNWIVYLEKEYLNNIMHTINVSETVTLGGNDPESFPKVLAYQILPDKPVKAKKITN